MLQSSNRPLAIFNVADEYLGPHYGGVVKNFGELCHSQYEKIARDFTVIRILVDDPNQLVATINRIANMFPQAPILHWALDGHGDATSMEIGGGSDDAVLTIDDNNILQEIVNRVSPLGTIALWGCSCAEGERNLARQLSLFGCIVYGSDRPVSTIEYETYDSTVPNTPFLFPHFRERRNQELNAKIYSDNEELAHESTSQNFGAVDRIIGAIRLKALQQTQVTENSEPEAATIHFGNDQSATDDPEIMAMYQRLAQL